jgi:5'(3')-deoxyribonucleotidase
VTFTIGLDLDGVVYQWSKTARYMIRRRIEDRGETVPPELYQESQDWDWIRTHSPGQDWKWLWTEGTKAGAYRYGHVVSGAIEGVQELTKIGDVIVITARPRDAVNDTLAWLGTFFDKSPLAGVVIQSDGQKKSEAVPGLNVMIDDGPHNIMDILENTKADAILFSQPWNQNWSPERTELRLFRAKGWRETVNRVRAQALQRSR